MSLRYVLWRARYAIAAACFALAIAVIVAEATPHYSTVSAARLRHGVEAGHVLANADIETVELPRAAVPEGTLTAAQATSRLTLGPLPAGTVLSVGLLRGPDVLDAVSDGRVAVTIMLSELSVPLARQGARLALYAPVSSTATPGNTEATLLTREAVVLALRKERAGPGGEQHALCDIAIPAEVASVVLAHAAATPLVASTHLSPPRS